MEVRTGWLSLVGLPVRACAPGTRRGFSSSNEHCVSGGWVLHESNVATKASGGGRQRQLGVARSGAGRGAVRKMLRPLRHLLTVFCSPSSTCTAATSSASSDILAANGACAVGNHLSEAEHVKIRDAIGWLAAADRTTLRAEIQTNHCASSHPPPTPRAAFSVAI